MFTASVDVAVVESVVFSVIPVRLATPPVILILPVWDRLPVVGVAHASRPSEPR